jgi:predicted nucleic acid-binding protein
VILIDAGPLIAVVRGDDQHHAACTSVLPTIREPMGTVWPVLSEVMFLLANIPGAQEQVWEMIARGAVQLLPLGPDDVPRIRELMRQYSDLPMDLADAALVRVGERERVHQFFTVDRKDFAVYRLHGRIRPRVLP